jgi:hypothetical protein
VVLLIEKGDKAAQRTIVLGFPAGTLARKLVSNGSTGPTDLRDIHGH